MDPNTMTIQSNGAPVVETEFSSYYIVHQDHAGFVIGAGGKTIQDIAEKTNTWIRIQPVNEWSFGHPWFLIKGRSKDVVAMAYHYISTISEEANRRNPKWSVEHLTDKDLDNIDEFYETLEDGVLEEHLLWKEYIIENEIEMDRVSTFNAALTDFEIKIADREIKREQEWEMMWGVAIPDELKAQRKAQEIATPRWPWEDAT